MTQLTRSDRSRAYSAGFDDAGLAAQTHIALQVLSGEAMWARVMGDALSDRYPPTSTSELRVHYDLGASGPA